VNSTLGCSLVTAKIAFDAAGRRPLIAHVEAGLRSFDRAMPEEVNRIVTDHLSDLLFVTEQAGIRNLQNEGVSSDRIHFVGNTMIDSLLAYKEKAESSPVLTKLGLRKEGMSNGNGNSVFRYALLTMHRPSNVDNREIFMKILAGLADLAGACPVIFPVHPRTQRRIKDFALDSELAKHGVQMVSGAQLSNNGRHGIVMIDPLGYLDFLCMMKHAAIVVTDSGGIQEETTCLGVPCVTVRENTERPVTVESGTNVIAGTGTEKIREVIRRQMERTGGQSAPENWDGRAATRIVDTLVRTHVSKIAAGQLAVPQPCA
jgi:UDP-N-acetylglucosamine 2-epimerase (non-hydrolysing)